MLPNGEQNMDNNEKKAYLDKIRSRYRKACKKMKAKILDEFCAVCSYHRKHAINSHLRTYPFLCQMAHIRQ